MSRDFKSGDTIWFKNPKADMHNVLHCMVTTWQLEFRNGSSELFYLTENHGWVSEYNAAHSKEEALQLAVSNNN